jgi:hypothetical protein
MVGLDWMCEGCLSVLKPWAERRVDLLAKAEEEEGVYLLEEEQLLSRL